MKSLDKITKNKPLMAIAKGVCSIALLTAVSAISVHYLTGDTLSEYAKKNPELAYKNDSDTDVATDTYTAPVSKETLEDYPDDELSSENITDTAPDYLYGPMIHFYDPDVISEARTQPYDGFYYEPLTDEMVAYITGTSYPADSSNLEISIDDLRYVGIKYNDFANTIQAGELICNEYIAQDIVDIFYELYTSGYQLEKVVLIDNYEGDDTASMCADNTSCFNYRVVDNTTSISKHAYGLAIDINPFYNPYIVFGRNEDGSDYISPAGSEIYADRSSSFPYKIDSSDLCYRLFKEHGFTWGGDWNSCKDYQHFQKTK